MRLLLIFKNIVIRTKYNNKFSIIVRNSSLGHLVVEGQPVLFHYYTKGAITKGVITTMSVCQHLDIKAMDFNSRSAKELQTSNLVIFN